MFWKFSICDGHFDTRDLIPNISEVQDGKLENRQKKVNCELLQIDVTKANFRHGLSLNLFQLKTNTLRSQNFVQKPLNWLGVKIAKCREEMRWLYSG